MRAPKTAGFTFVEFMVSVAAFAVLTLVLLSFTNTSLRMISRNFATNHGHQAIRTASQRLINDLHNSASSFRLMDFDGTNYTDITPTATSDQDALNSQASPTQYISTRANTVRFWRQAGGPYQLTSSATPGSTSLSFNFSVNGTLPYVPKVGDKLELPLIGREYDISAVTTTPTAGSPNGTVTISDAKGLGYTLTTGTGYITTAYFYRRTAYSVWNRQLRYHDNFYGAQMNSTINVSENITSPKPFSLLYQNGSIIDDSLSLRVSLETYDKQYVAPQIFRAGTTTMQSIGIARNHPALISNAN